MTDTWRFIDTGPCSAAYNMALDEAIANAVRKGDVPPTLRLYEWDVPSISIGCFQKISDINLDYCIQKRIPIVRRPTGGRAVLHNHELTYSFSAKTKKGIFSKGLLDSYKKISHAFSLAFTKIGLLPQLNLMRKTQHSALSTQHSKSPICFQSTSYGEITINNKKNIGSAQKRWSDGLLQQGSIPTTIDTYEMMKVFILDSDNIGKDSFTGLKEILHGLTHDELKNTIRISFEETFDIHFISSTPSQEESALAEELAFQKYLSPRWNFQR
jgi:lipoate-protein ligase A